MNAIRWTSRTVLCALVSVLLISGGCGVKAPPVPPRSVPPAAVSDLSFTLDNDLVTLKWSIPTGRAAGTAGLAKFIVYRAVAALSNPICDGCPALFRRVGEIGLETLMAGDPDRKTAIFRQKIEKGYQYIYKVTAVSNDGQRGPDSNRVVIR